MIVAHSNSKIKYKKSRGKKNLNPPQTLKEKLKKKIQ
jgi:hypothetical protein